MMAVMTAQPPLPMAPVADAVPIGAAAALVEGEEGGRVFLHGQLVYAWDAGQVALRRLAAVQLVRIRAAEVGQVAAAFGVNAATLWRWGKALAEGVDALVPGKPGPKGPSRLTPQVVADIASRRSAGASLAQIGAELDLAPNTVRNALLPTTSTPEQERGEQEQPGIPERPGMGEASGVYEEAPVLPVLPAAADRTGERVAARAGLIEHAAPVFAPAARVPLAGLLTALPGLKTTGLLTVARDVYKALPEGFYGLDTMLTEGVLRALAGEPRAEGATRLDPTALGRVLGLDRAPEVKTIRRKIAQLAARGKATELLAGIAAHHLADHKDSQEEEQVGVVLYVDGHVRAYTGTRKIAKTHSARLRFPAPATVETWVADADGDPVLVVMAAPGASLAGELRRLLPDLRTAVGDDRRVLVAFDRGGWSPALFEHMHAHGFDVLTWRKGPAPDVPAGQFAEHTRTDPDGRTRTLLLADTVVDLPLGRVDEHDRPEVFTMRQVTRLDTKKGTGRQVHMLTTRTDIDAGEVVYRMGSRWRQENYFRYARMHFDLDSHDSYATSDDDPDRSVPNPAKRAAHKQVQAAYAREQREKARAQAALLTARTPARGQSQATISNQAHNAITAPWHAAQDDLVTARAAHAAVPTRVRLGDLHPGQQVLDTQTKLIHHAIRMAAYNTATAIARDIRINTGYHRAKDEAHVLARQVLTHTGDIDPTTPGVLTVRLDPLPTPRATAAVAELCQHLTATATRYPGTDLLMRYEIKTHP